MNIHVSDGQSGDSVDYSTHHGCNTMAALFRHQCKRYGDATAHREKDLGIWKSYTWNEYYSRARAIAHAMRKLGVKRGDVVSILSVAPTEAVDQLDGILRFKHSGLK